MGCSPSVPVEDEEVTEVYSAKPPTPNSSSPEALVATTHFTWQEVERLRGIYDRISNRIHYDGLIHRDEFMWALFKAPKDNLFAERIFKQFDIKRNSVIDFEEFVRSLSVFHPRAALEEKAQFAFNLYDIEGTGTIDPGEVRRFLVSLTADNPAMQLDAETIDQIVQDTFSELDLAGDGRIHPEEWLAAVRESPSLVAFMTLPELTRID